MNTHWQGKERQHWALAAFTVALLAMLAGCSGPAAPEPSLSTVDSSQTGSDLGASGTDQDTLDAAPQDEASATDVGSSDSASTACQSQSQCAADQACMDSVCSPAVPCKSDKNCLSLDAVCDSAAGHCVQCEESVDCQAEWTCKDRVCVAPAKPCASTKECGNDQVCDKAKGLCVQCVDQGDCAGGASCLDGLCVVEQCQDGDAQCVDALTRKLCNGGQWIEAACQSGQGCEGGACKPQTCQPGASQCQGPQLQQCAANGLQWLAATDCPAEQVCMAGACANQECASGQTKCAGNALQTCTAQGLWQSAPCGPSQVCVAESGKGVCKPQLCAPGSKSCQGNAIATCDATGTAKTVAAPCPLPSICQDGGCVSAPLCAAGSSSCADDTTVQTCAADGKSYATTACQAGKVCGGGKCTVPSCSAGQVQCVGDVVQSCGSGGNWTSILDCQQNSASCKNGSCVTNPCIFGNYGCVDGVPAFCTKDAGWSKQTACPSGQVCINKGECKAKLCTPWQPFCQGDAASVCDSTGTKATVISNCANNGQLCSAGNCEAAPAVCQAGAKQCQGSALQTCNAQGTAWSSNSCDDGDPCTADGCSQGQCTKVTAADGTPCTGGGSGCEAFACTAGKCTSQGPGLWQKTLGVAGGTAVPWRAKTLPDGTVQWAGTWFPAGSTKGTAWLGRTAPTGSVTASWSLTGDIAWYATAWTAQGTWIARSDEVLLVGNTGAPEVQVKIPAVNGYGWASITMLAAHPDGGTVVLMGSSKGASGYQTEVIRVSQNGMVSWRTQTPMPVSSGFLSVASSGAILLYANANLSGGPPMYLTKLGADGVAAAPVKLALTEWPSWIDFQFAKVAASDDVIAAARTYKACTGGSCFSEWQDLGVARLGPAGSVLWQTPLASSLGSDEVVGGTWIDGDTVVVVSSIGDWKVSGWIWTRLRLSDGKVLFSKGWTVSGQWGGYVPVAAPAGNGAVLALRSSSGDAVLSPTFRVDAWGNPSCSESAGCAAKSYASCDDGNPCTFENCLAGVCLHTNAPDGLACGAGKCSGGKCN